METETGIEMPSRGGWATTKSSPISYAIGKQSRECYNQALCTLIDQTGGLTAISPPLPHRLSLHFPRHPGSWSCWCQTLLDPVSGPTDESPPNLVCDKCHPPSHHF